MKRRCKCGYEGPMRAGFPMTARRRYCPCGRRVAIERRHRWWWRAFRARIADGEQQR